ncbi:MAG: hypothetical protein KGM98_11455 [Bacteroidota bacterium]|nr:hypothetical protein [Bacteroidota bacterium]
MNKLYVTGNFTLVKDHFFILIVTDGEGEISAGKEIQQLKFWDKFLIPAKTKKLEISTQLGLELFLAMPAE